MAAFESGDPVEITVRLIQIALLIFGVTKQCFTGDTLVATSDGLKPIEDIKAGDYVWAEEVESGEQKLQEVQEVFVSLTTDLTYVETSTGEVINTTTGHPFYVEEKGWVIASELSAGDVLRTQDGNLQTIVSVVTEEFEEPIKVYNLKVSEYHTYYVTDDNVLVHNDGCEWDDYYKEGRPEGGNPREDTLIRKDIAKIKSEEFKAFLESLGETPSKWKKVMETWETPDGFFYERHYWTNGSNSYHHD